MATQKIKIQKRSQGNPVTDRQTVPQETHSTTSYPGFQGSIVSMWAQLTSFGFLRGFLCPGQLQEMCLGCLHR